MSWTLPRLSYPPLQQRLLDLVAALKAREDELEFVVLFGSSARGEARRGSDLDLLIGLRQDGCVRFLDRLGDYSTLVAGVDAFPYYPSEIRLMLEQLHMTLLECADHGLVLFDRGAWAELSARLTGLISSGRILRQARGWRVADPTLLRR